VIISATLFTFASWSLIAAVLWPIYQDASFVVLAVVALVLATSLGVISTIGRWPAWGVILAASAVFIVVGVPLAVPSRTIYGVLPEPEGLIDLIAGIALGWRQLVTIDLPVGSYQALLVPALVLLLIGPLITITIALRTDVGELAALVPLAALALAIGLGAERVALPIATAIVLAAVLLLWMAVWRRHRRRASLGAATAAADSRWAGTRAIATALALVLVAGGAGAAAVALLPPAGDRTVLRTVVERPFEPLEQPSPLAAYRASFAVEVADSPAITITGAPAASRVRLAVLDSYDGVVFAVGSDSADSASGRFVRIPTRRDLTGVEGDRAQVTIRLDRPTGVWLPLIGEFGAIDFDGDDAADLRDLFVFNAVTESAALVGGTAAGLTYTLDAVVADDDRQALASVVPGQAEVPGIVAVPESLREWLDAVAPVDAAPGVRLQDAIAALLRDGYLSHGIADDEAPSRSGHSLERLDELFTQRPMIGDAEQYAAAAALIARELGFPSRVVLGFGPLEAGSSITLLESDRTAWIEISTGSSEWVPVDVVPERRELPPLEPDDPIPVSRPQNAPQPPVDDPPALEELAPPEIEQSDDPELDPFWQTVLMVVRVLGWVLLIAGLIASPMLGVVAAKLRRRRRRRRAGDPTTRILGGWSELIDEARDFGLELPPAATRTELARALSRPQALVLARVADRAVYAPEEPTTAEADTVWLAADAVRASLGEGRSRRDRWRAAVSPASLRRYPGTTPASTGGRRA
jgi:hypothetical protein